MKYVNVSWLLNWGKKDTSFVSVSHRRLDVKLKQDSDPDKKHSIKDIKEKNNEEHKNKKRHADDLSDENPQYEKHPQEIIKEKHQEESKKQRPAEDEQVETDNKKQKHVQDLQSEKHNPEPRKERPLEEPKKIRHMEEVIKEKHPEEPKRHSYIDDAKKEKHKEENRHEKPVNTAQRQRPPSEPQREKPADVQKPMFERWEESGSKKWLLHIRNSRASDWVMYFRRGVLDSSILYPTRFPSPPRPARPPLPIKRPSLEQKKDRLGLYIAWAEETDMFLLMLHDTLESASLICTDICSCSFITKLMAYQDTAVHCACCGQSLVSPMFLLKGFCISLHATSLGTFELQRSDLFCCKVCSGRTVKTLPPDILVLMLLDLPLLRQSDLSWK